MRRAVVTGAAGLVGSETTLALLRSGWRVTGVDNDMRATFFGPDASTSQGRAELETWERYQHVECDISRADEVDRLFKELNGRIELLVHAAAQPSHDWSAGDPRRDFEVNAVGTLNLLEALRQSSSVDAVFVLMSTNKVYGDRPNLLPLTETNTRWELPDGHRFHAGIDESMSLDSSLHSPFGVSKAAADLLTQEYARYFDLRTVVLRCGCITGSRHAGARLHGFLSYLMRCALSGTTYQIYGYEGKQVRDNIDARDVAWAIELIADAPTAGRVYNLGGGRASNCSLLEAIAACERLSGQRIRTEYVDKPRVGDHQWWISDTSRFATDYPQWRIRHDWQDSLSEMLSAHRP